jgi:NAD(P)-dependent dehydrogenase (short-subunit alcohol dehydrogenase family)
MSGPGPFSLVGKLAVVSGGTRGIGLAIARGLGRAGAEVVLIGRDRAKAEESTVSLVGEGLTASFLLADVTREEDC